MKVYENENCGPLTLYVIFNEILIATVIFNEILIATEDNCVLHLIDFTLFRSLATGF